ncbi:MAG: GNAT family N-acetyltransferase [Eubacteriales bacterium]
MENISLIKIDESNFIDAFNLELGEGQEEFVSHPIRSLAQAYVYYSQCTPFGIYCGEVMVGYVMVIYDHDLEEYDIWHMMIDKKYQHRGYGRAALGKCLEYISTKPFGASDRVALTCNRKNAAALSLYMSMGFSETGAGDEDETELALTLHA